MEQQLELRSELSTAERDFMLRWNVFLHEHPCLADAHLAQRSLDFAAAEADAFSYDADLKQCFIVHLVNLWEFNIIDATTLDKCIAAMTKADRLQPCRLNANVPVP